MSATSNTSYSLSPEPFSKSTIVEAIGNFEGSVANLSYSQGRVYNLATQTRRPTEWFQQSTGPTLRKLLKETLTEITDELSNGDERSRARLDFILQPMWKLTDFYTW